MKTMVDISRIQKAIMASDHILKRFDQELEANPRVLVFGEDVGPKGGVHAVTLGLQEKFGRERVFEYASARRGTRVAIVRLNYAIDLRYGVLVDIARRRRPQPAAGPSRPRAPRPSC